MIDIKNPIATITTLPVSGKSRLGVFDLKLARTLVVTIRGSYNASATDPLRCNLYYTPNEYDWDTVPYTWFDLTLTQNIPCQRTCIIDPPEKGLMALEVENKDAVYTITNISIWANLEFWSEDKK